MTRKSILAPALMSLLAALFQASSSRAAPDAADGLDSIRMEIVTPKEGVTLRTANASSFRFRIRLTNEGKDAVRILRHWSIQLEGKDGLKVERTLGIGRWGEGYPDKEFLARSVLEIPPGGSIEIAEGIASYTGDLRRMEGFSLSGEGACRIELTYDFSRKALQPMFAEALQGDEASRRLWDSIAQGKRAFAGDLRVRPPDGLERKAEKDRDEMVEDVIRRVVSGQMSPQDFRKAVDGLSPEEQQRVLEETLSRKVPHLEDRRK